MAEADTPAHELARRVRAREARAVDVTEAALGRAHALQSQANAFVTIADEEARAAAARIDAALDAGRDPGPLAGVPFVAKDNLCTGDVRTTAGSRSLEGFRPPFDATVTARLAEAGAVLIAKTNLDEFGMGDTNEYSAFGAVRNPWDPARAPGGSSGGSAAAVAAGVAPLALGTDTGGSVRQPAAHSGVLGFKPTYGTLSRYGVIAFASSLDQVGVLARDVEDAALALDAMVGRDPADATSLAVEPGFARALAASLDAATEAQPLAGLRVGWVGELCGEGNDPEVAAAVEDARARFERLGATVREVSVPNARAGVASYHLVAAAEASSNLARFDGMITGARHGELGEGQEAVMVRSRARTLGREVRRRVLMGSFALSAGYADAWYGQALRVRRRLSEELDAAFASVDLLLTPTAPSAAASLGADAEADDPLRRYLGDVDTCLANLVGVPAMSVPWGRNAAGLPLAVQLMAPALEDGRTFAAAGALQRAAGAAFAPRAPDLGRGASASAS